MKTCRKTTCLAAGRAGKSGAVDKATFKAAIEDFYLTNPIARASAVMAECSRLASGKLLTADKVVVVAQAAGPHKFADSQWAHEFASAATAALGKPMVHIDVGALSISY